jgi:hypothetical protein
MNITAARPVLSLACLAGLTVASMPAMEIEQARAVDDFYLGVDLLSKQYDQGIVRNDDATVRETLAARYFDFGVKLQAYQALGEVGAAPSTISAANHPKHAKAGETTELSLRLDYLIEMKDLFQILPFYEGITYPYLSSMPLKSDQNWLGVDAWWMTPLAGVELGGSVAYNAFYDVKSDTGGMAGWSNGHMLKGSFGAREFYQYAPIDVTLWQMFNWGNSNYNRFMGQGDLQLPATSTYAGNSDWKHGLNTFDIGATVLHPLAFRDWWFTASAEGHFWVMKADRERLADNGIDRNEFVLSMGVRYWPGAEEKVKN